MNTVESGIPLLKCINESAARTGTKLTTHNEGRIQRLSATSGDQSKSESNLVIFRRDGQSKISTRSPAGVSGGGLHLAVCNSSHSLILPVNLISSNTWRDRSLS
jgi:hypothetical protein